MNQNQKIKMSKQEKSKKEEVKSEPLSEKQTQTIKEILTTQPEVKEVEKPIKLSESWGKPNKK